ncbi:hypothetical protein [Pseudomonas sp.]|uniref:hypothetical protein n=1 Tax=Pseudomonas sp. TaxID=306 RepID=UPI003F317209
MSQQSEKSNFNLVRNGNFSEDGTSWTHNSPAKVSFEEGFCHLHWKALITQRIKSNVAGNFKFSARMKADKGFGAQATLEMLPSQQTVHLRVGGGDPWANEEQIVKVPAGTNEIIVTLLANDGVPDKFGAFFDDVALTPL